MVHPDQAIRRTKHVLDALVRPNIEFALPARQTVHASPVAPEPGPQNDRVEPNV